MAKGDVYDEMYGGAGPKMGGDPMPGQEGGGMGGEGAPCESEDCAHNKQGKCDGSLNIDAAQTCLSFENKPMNRPGSKPAAGDQGGDNFGNG